VLPARVDADLTVWWLPLEGEEDFPVISCPDVIIAHQPFRLYPIQASDIEEFSIVSQPCFHAARRGIALHRAPVIENY